MSYISRVSQVFFSILIFLGLALEVAKAMSVTPIVTEMAATGRTSKASITVVNDGKKKLPIEIIVYRVELGLNGEQSRKREEQEFVVFPPQALIAPGATQTFRIQWVGKPDIAKSQSYIFSVNQVPVKMPKGKSGVQLVYKFGTVVNVAPAVGEPSIKLLKSEVAKDPKGVRKPAVTVVNRSNVHARLSDATIKLSGSGWSKTLSPEYLQQRLGVGLVQPGKKRRLLLPVEVPANVSKVSASVSYKPKKRR